MERPTSSKVGDGDVKIVEGTHDVLGFELQRRSASVSKGERGEVLTRL